VALKMKRIPANACKWDSYINMLGYMRCPQGHSRVHTKAGTWKGRKYIEASCQEPECLLMQRVYEDELPEPV
jgi:hypothetical protein